MARIAEDEFADMPGQDSFLDVLTNIVGIIILLVVVVGLRTSQATVQAAVAEYKDKGNTDEAASKDQLAAARRAALVAQSELKGMVQQMVGVHDAASLREQERDYLTAYVAAFQQELDERRASLSADKQRDYDLRRKLAETQSKLDDLNREQITLFSQPSETEVIENQPTPLARRSTGKEIQCQLSGGYLAVIPDELIDAMIDDFKANVWRLRQRDRFVNTIGPMGGFRLRYLAARVASGRVDPHIPGSAQIPMAVHAELIQFELIPEKSPLGEPVTKALEPGSEFREALRNHPAGNCVVVIAVYPDSIRELHQLKDQLYAAGYPTADLPCIAGQTLKWSPRAPRSGQVFAQ